MARYLKKYSLKRQAAAWDVTLMCNVNLSGSGRELKNSVINAHQDITLVSAPPQVMSNKMWVMIWSIKIIIRVSKWTFLIIQR